MKQLFPRGKRIRQGGISLFEKEISLPYPFPCQQGNNTLPPQGEITVFS